MGDRGLVTVTCLTVARSKSSLKYSMFPSQRKNRFFLALQLWMKGEGSVHPSNHQRLEEDSNAEPIVIPGAGNVLEPRK